MNIIFGSHRCVEALNEGGMMFSCQRPIGHGGAHLTFDGRDFSDDEAWSKVRPRELEEQRRINAEIASRPGSRMTGS